MTFNDILKYFSKHFWFIKYILSVFYLRLLFHYRRYTYDIKMIPQCNRILKYNICKGKVTLLMITSRKPTGRIDVKFHAFHSSHLIGLNGSLRSPINSILRAKFHLGSRLSDSHRQSGLCIDADVCFLSWKRNFIFLPVSSRYSPRGISAAS
jgi:hypothetical protein